jgi:peptidyl-prolyl cis-trans isomerase B (cyclophilin B)
MTTKKQAREYEKRRLEKLQAKVEAREAAKRKRQRQAGWGLLAVAVVIVAAGLIWYGSTHWWGESDSASEPIATLPETTITPSYDAAPAEGWGASPQPPDEAFAEGRTWEVSLETSQGPITFELDGEAAPQAVASFVALARDGFFNNTECHRLVTSGIYVLQCGDPLGTGTGGPSYRFGPIENAPADNTYPAGTLAMARVQGNGESMGSQFFIVYEDSLIPSDNAGGYTVFGKVTQGLDIVEAVAAGGTITGDADGRPALSVIITEVTTS